VSGRFAPSPTGTLHIGNLRTALVAWCAARGSDLGFVVRMEDLDRVTSRRSIEQDQLADLQQLGLDWDEPVVRQSDRFDLHRDALRVLVENGLTFRCYCTRREIGEALSAPHGTSAASRYPGTCRRLTVDQIQAFEAAGRQPAIRLNAHVGAPKGSKPPTVEYNDLMCGPQRGQPDDIVLQRNDGVPAYHLAVVVDDADQGITQVVRGDDLLDATASQAHLAALLGLPTPTYAHVPLVLGTDGARLAKRHGSVSLAERTELLGTTSRVVGEMAWSLGLAPPGEELSPPQVLQRFDWSRLPRLPWRLTPSTSPES